MRVIKGLIRFLWVVSIFVSSCYDDSELWEHIRDHENRITKLEDFCNQINNNLISLRNVIDAIQTREYVKDVIPVYDEGCCIGYTITFNGRDPITLLNGKNGTNAQTPIIGVKKDADGVWYWTLNGNWLLDESGSMVVASGRNGSDGHDGMDGSNGNDGIDGTNGITPQLIIENDNWMVSYDNGVNWQILGPAYQLNDKDECPVIKSITQDEHFVTIVLANGEIIQLTKYNPSGRKSEESHNIENIGVQVYQNVVYNNNDYSYTCIGYLASALASPYNQIPNGKIIQTDVDSTAQSRYLEYADNAGFAHCTKIPLDLTSEEFVLYNLEGNKLYYYRVYKDNNPYLQLNCGSFKTTGTVRQLKIESSNICEKTWLNNVRDIGGWKASGNRIIRYGVIFRGPELNHITDGEEQIFISSAGIEELKRLNISAELDLRSGYESSVLGDDVKYCVCPLDLWFYRLNIYCNVKPQAVYYANAIKQILSCLRENRSIYIHCKGGCDRTGALCAIIEGLCGVSENDINHDYELSGRDRSREYYTLANGASYDGDFKFAMEYIKGLMKYKGHIYVYYRGKYYSAEDYVQNYTPNPITDSTVINYLSNQNLNSLQVCFRLLMELGGLTNREMEELEQILCS